MVKVYAPALSLDASGTIGDAITFSKWKGRHYVRERIIPANPRSGLQVSFRAMFKFLAQRWTDLSAANKATWDDLGDQLVASPFNGFVHHNQKRWRNFKPPTLEYPETEVGTLGTFSGGSAPAATGGVASITLDFTLGTANDNWGLLIFRATSTGFSTALSNLIAAVKLTTTAASKYIDTPLTAGTYYYNTRLYTDDGVVGAEDGEINAAAT